MGDYWPKMGVSLLSLIIFICFILVKSDEKILLTHNEIMFEQRSQQVDDKQYEEVGTNQLLSPIKSGYQDVTSLEADLVENTWPRLTSNNLEQKGALDENKSPPLLRRRHRRRATMSTTGQQNKKHRKKVLNTRAPKTRPKDNKEGEGSGPKGRSLGGTEANQQKKSNSVKEGSSKPQGGGKKSFGGKKKQKKKSNTVKNGWSGPQGRGLSSQDDFGRSIGDSEPVDGMANDNPSPQNGGNQTAGGQDAGSAQNTTSQSKDGGSAQNTTGQSQDSQPTGGNSSGQATPATNAEPVTEKERVFILDKANGVFEEIKPEEEGEEATGKSSNIIPKIRGSRRKWQKLDIWMEKRYTKEEADTFNKTLDAIRNVASCLPINLLYEGNGDQEPDEEKQSYLYMMYEGRKGYCHSDIGQRNDKGSQGINIPPGSCFEFRNSLHVLMHALGFNHEQVRPDRDDHLQILWHNIDPDFYSVFEIDNKAPYVGQYDVNSVMHYGDAAYGISGRTLIENENATEVGPNDKYEKDLEKIRLLYCPTSKPGKKKCKCQLEKFGPCKDEESQEETTDETDTSGGGSTTGPDDTGTGAPETVGPEPPDDSTSTPDPGTGAPPPGPSPPAPGPSNSTETPLDDTTAKPPFQSPPDI